MPRQLRAVTAIVVQLALIWSVFAISLAVAPAQPAEASHFRATQLTWRTVGGFTAEFTSTIGLRRSFFGSPGVGSTVTPMTINWGNGSTSPAHTVIALDAANDWILARAIVNRVYSSAGPWTVTASTCCRLGSPQHRNNPDQNNRAETIVNFSATTASPVSSISPVVDCPRNAVCSFVVPALDADGQAIRYRFATSVEATGSTAFRQPGPPHAPNAATIDATTGVYSWDTTGASLNPTTTQPSYYSTQVMVENLDSAGAVITKTAVDFFIRLTATASTNQAPAFVAPTPADGTVISVQAGSPVTFNVSASDPNATDTVTLAMLNKPAAATYTTTSGNPASGTFSWTPAAGGSTILTLTAQDQLGLGAVQRSVTINVTTNRPPTANAGGPYSVAEGGSITLSGTGSDPDGDALSFSWDLDNDTSFETSGASPTFSAAGRDGPSGQAVVLRVCDSKGLCATSGGQLNIVNVPPSITAIGNTGPVDEGSSLVIDVTATDPAASLDPLSYWFDCNGDGIWDVGPQPGASAACLYPDGTTSFSAKVMVTDGDGGAANGSTMITVLNVAPTITSFTNGGPIDEASTVSLSVAATDPAGAYDPLAYSFDCDGNGTYEIGPHAGPSASCFFADDGVYSVGVRVDDGDGGLTTASTAVIVRNVVPIIRSVSGGSAIPEASTALISVVASDQAGPADPLSYEFDCDANGTFEVSPQTASTAPCSFADNGIFTVGVRVSDGDGGVVLGSTTVTVNNVAPTIVSTGNDGPIDEGGSARISATATDPAGPADPLSYSFDCDGDAVFEVGPQSSATASCFFDDNGTRTVGIRVDDGDGGVASGRTMVTVRNVAPTVVAGADRTSAWGLPVALEVLSVSDPSAADTVEGYTVGWYFGDPPHGAPADASGHDLFVASHIYALPGTYAVKVEAADKDGGRGLDGILVTITKRPSTLSCTGGTGAFGFGATLSATLGDPVDTATAILGANTITFSAGGLNATGQTSAGGAASAASPLLAPGTYSVTATFGGNVLYEPASASCSLTITNSAGLVTSGIVKVEGKGRGGMNVQSDGTTVKGELQFQNSTIDLHVHTMTALGISADHTRAWFAGTGTNGQSVLAYVEDNGEPGTSDLFKLWVDGAAQNGDGALSGGNVQIH